MKFDRTLGILVSLLARERVTAQDLADRWEVTVRTIYRDLRSLEAAGIPLASVPGPGGGLDLIEGFTLDRHLLKPDELDRLRGALAGLARVFPDPAVTSGQRKLEALVGGVAESELIYLDLDAWSSPDGSGELSRLMEACQHRRVCRVVYRDGQGTETTRELEPQTLVWRSRWYLFAWCRLRKAHRLFRVSALSQVRSTGETAIRRSETYQSTIKAAESQVPRFEVTIRFSAAKAHLAPRAPLARNVVVEPSGRVSLTVDLRPEDAFEYCARWGADLEVLAPQSLRDQFRFLAEGLAGLYATPAKLP